SRPYRKRIYTMENAKVHNVICGGYKPLVSSKPPEIMTQVFAFCDTYAFQTSRKRDSYMT
ncbi:hypothetical protein, partial [Bacillus cereus]|uniref:hypothetical protein n=1 Tax=Bacillus cereus TaxID=1396 RepID=UPI0034D5BDF5